MQKLKPGEFTHLSENVLKALIQNQIATILEFLQEDVAKISTITKLNLPQVLSIRSEIFARYSAPLINGSSLLLRSLKNEKFIFSGIHSLDTSIGGGIPIGYITELCGLADCGKTQLSFQYAINCVKNTDNTVLYVDTKGDFSAVRLQKILDSCQYSHKEMALLMYKIRVIHLWKMDDLIELLKSLKNKTVIIEKLALIIIDSLPCLMFQYLGDDNKMGLSLLNTFVNYCRFLCRELNIGIICVNIQTRWVNQDVSDLEDEGEYSAFKDSFIEQRNRCLGKYWQRIPALVLLLEKYQEKSSNNDCQIKVTVLKSSNVIYEQRQCILNISACGVT